jgi:putative membrane protein (TIGR04086 family)
VIPAGLIAPRAVGIGAGVAIAIAVPSALAGQLLADAESNLVFLFFLAVLVGFVLGGSAAARRAPEAPFTNGALAAVAAYLLIQGLAIISLLVRGEPIRVPQILFNALVAYGSGLLGGLMASRRAGAGTRLDLDDERGGGTTHP